MAIDLEQLRKKYEELNKTGKKDGEQGDSNFITLDEGTTQVRILPSKDETKPFFAETKIHRPIIDGKVLNMHCRKIHGEPCPLCELYFSLWKTKNKDDEALARKIKPTLRYYMNAIDRRDGKVKIFSVGTILFKIILGAVMDKDYGDVTDLNEGFDFKVTKVMEKGSDGQVWPKYSESKFRPVREPAAKSAQEKAALLEQMHDIYSLVKLEEFDYVNGIAETLKAKKVTVNSERKDKTTESTEDDDSEYLKKLKV